MAASFWNKAKSWFQKTPQAPVVLPLPGLQSQAQGLEVAQVWVLDEENRYFLNTNFVYGQRLCLFLQGVKGLMLEAQVYQPGLSLRIYRKMDNALVFECADVFADKPEGIAASHTGLYAYLTLAQGLRMGESYRLEAQLVDKLQTDNCFKLQFSFQLKSPPGLEIFENKGLDYRGIYLWDASLQSAVSLARVQRQKPYSFYIEGLAGFHEKEAEVRLKGLVQVMDEQNRLLQQNLDLFPQPSLKAEEVKAGLSFDLEFDAQPGSTKTIHLQVRLEDRNSDKYLFLRYNFWLD